VQRGRSDVVSKVEQVLKDVKDSIRHPQLDLGECSFQVPPLLNPINYRYVQAARGSSLHIAWTRRNVLDNGRMNSPDFTRAG